MKKVLIDLDFLVSDIYFYETTLDRKNNTKHNNALELLNSKPIDCIWYWLNDNQSKMQFTAFTRMSKTPLIKKSINKWINEWEVPIDSVVFNSEDIAKDAFDVALFPIGATPYDRLSADTDIYWIRLSSNAVDSFDFFEFKDFGKLDERN